MQETKTLPEQIVETSHAFTQSLEMENTVFQGQLNGIVKMTVDALQQLIVLCREAGTPDDNSMQVGQKLADLKQQALTHLQEAAVQAGKAVAPTLVDTSSPTDTAGQGLNEAAVQSIGISYKNAVNAQQQMYITQQAATTMVISTLLSTVTATVSKEAAVV